MAHKLTVLLVGRSATALKELSAGLAKARNVACTTRLLGNGHGELLSGIHPLPDVLVLRFDSESLHDLAALAETSPDSRPPLIVIGPAASSEAMRLAVRSGARDFLVEPINPEELIAVLERVRQEPRHGHTAAAKADVTLVLGAAGGVGTSFIASSLAHALASETNAPTLLMDLDLNGAPLASFLDLAPDRGLPQALAEVEFLDEHALQGYVSKHRSGLHLMGMPAKSFMLSKDLDPARCATLMGIVTTRYRHVVVDASHTLDDLSLAALGMAKTIVLVVQQSIVQLKQAARLLRLLYAEAGIPDDRILVVVNRHLKRSTVGLEDIRRTLAREKLSIVPSQYQTVQSSIDGGVPVLDLDRTSAVAKAIIELQREVTGTPRLERTSLLRRALPKFSGN